jgi:hypothetical protein
LKYLRYYFVKRVIACVWYSVRISIGNWFYIYIDSFLQHGNWKFSISSTFSHFLFVYKPLGVISLTLIHENILNGLVHLSIWMKPLLSFREDFERYTDWIANSAENEFYVQCYISNNHFLRQYNLPRTFITCLWYGKLCFVCLLLFLFFVCFFFKKTDSCSVYY